MVGEQAWWDAVVVGSVGAVWLGLWGPGLWGPALGGAAHEARLWAQPSRMVGRSVGLGIAVVRSRGTAVGVLGVGWQN